ncbi:hypothetical protein DFS34DRAFT_590215 [Phlyctochytrium arcticum]|nr:hypothetical protein DFS34DRAFT_590215 [Phlyctochytrium arcticum]
MSQLNSRTSSGLRTLDRVEMVSPIVSGQGIVGKGDNVSIEGFNKGSFKVLENQNGVMEVNSFEANIAPLTSKNENGHATVEIKLDEERLHVSQGALSIIDLISAEPVSIQDRVISLMYDDTSLFVNGENELSVKQVPPKVNSPVFINDDGEVELEYASHFKDDEGLFDLDGSLLSKGLSLKISDPFKFDTFNSHKLSLKIDSDTLDINGGELTVKEKDYEHPLFRDDNTVGIHIHHPLYLSEDGISLNATSPFTTNDEGALKLNIDEETLEIKDEKLFAKAQDATKLLKGLGALSVYRDPLESLDTSLVKLDVDHENFQQTGGKLSFRSTGMGEIPYDSGLSSLRRSDFFKYNETLNELHVPHVVLSQNLSPSYNEAVTSSYVDQLYQAGSGVDISAKVNSRREISVRTDASLAIDINNNLSVNPSAFVNNQSIRVSSEGKLTSGLIFQQMNNLGIRNGNEVFLDLQTQGNLEFDGAILIDSRTFGNGLLENSSHEVSLDLTVDGALSMNSTKTHITENLTASNGVTRVGNDIRGAYTAGNNISISGSTISCTYETPEPEPEQPYFGGNGITVTGKTISNTFSLTAGTGVILVGSPGIGYTISTIDTSHWGRVYP